MNNPAWEWLIRSRVSAWEAQRLMQEPGSLEHGPGWCFDRFGQSSTALPDGRTVLIGGEHEDFYDPDFYIYNDVVLRHPAGEIDILGYPRAVFPPTDFHSATLLPGRIVIIGNLGYPEQRRPEATPAFLLELDGWSISELPTHGAAPGWLHAHRATLIEGGQAVLVTGGTLDRGNRDISMVENIDDWRLELASGRWDRLTDRAWPRRAIGRQDRRPLGLWEFRQAAWYRSVNWMKNLEDATQALRVRLGFEPDLALLEELYRPPLPHRPIASSPEDYAVFRIEAEGLGIRYVEDDGAVILTVEGALPSALVDQLTADLEQKLTRLLRVPMNARVI